MIATSMATACPDAAFLCRFMPASETAFSWFALRIRERLRSVAETHLANLDTEVFSPVTTELRQWSDRKKAIDIPLFAGYLFCRFRPERHISVLRAPGVMDIVRTGQKPAAVDPAELNAIDQALRSTSAIEPLPHLVYGDRFKVTAGPLAGLEGTLLNMRSEWKLVLAVTMMNRSVAVQIERSQVIAI